MRLFWFFFWFVWDSLADVCGVLSFILARMDMFADKHGPRIWAIGTPDAWNVELRARRSTDA